MYIHIYMYVYIFLSRVASPALILYAGTHKYTQTRYIYVYACLYVYVFLPEYSTGGRRPIGCLKLQVIFRKRTTNYRFFLREMTYKDQASFGSSPPCSFASFDVNLCFVLVCERARDRVREGERAQKKEREHE